MSSFDSKKVQQLAQLESEIFNTSLCKSKILLQTPLKASPLTTIALKDDKIIGFKLGYNKSPEIFYSWLGGVLLEYRKQGLAQSLMETQHMTLKEKGYSKVQTKTRGHFKAMLALNLKMGFKIISEHKRAEDGQIEILMEKLLS